MWKRKTEYDIIPPKAIVCAIALLVLDPASAVIILKIFEMVASGIGVSGIVQYLNGQGLPPPIQYTRFQQLLSTSNKDIPLSEIVGFIEKVVVDGGGKTMVK